MASWCLQFLTCVAVINLLRVLFLQTGFSRGALSCYTILTGLVVAFVPNDPVATLKMKNEVGREQLLVAVAAPSRPSTHPPNHPSTACARSGLREGSS